MAPGEMAQVLELAGALPGILGALLLASRCRWAAWAWPVWLASNAGWIGFGMATGHWALVAQNAVFAGTSALGCWVWLVRPALPRLVRRVDFWAIRATVDGMFARPSWRGRAAGAWVRWRGWARGVR